MKLNVNTRVGKILLVGGVLSIIHYLIFRIFGFTQLSAMIIYETPALMAVTLILWLKPHTVKGLNSLQSLIGRNVFLIHKGKRYIGRFTKVSDSKLYFKITTDP